MPNYPTSYYKKIRGNQRRHFVTYQEEDGDKVITFSVKAHSLSEASALTIQFIEANKLNKSPNGYALTPKVSAEKADYEI